MNCKCEYKLTIESPLCDCRQQGEREINQAIEELKRTTEVKRSQVIQDQVTPAFCIVIVKSTYQGIYISATKLSLTCCSIQNLDSV